MKRAALVLAMVAMSSFAQAGQEEYPSSPRGAGTSTPNGSVSSESPETSPQNLVYVPVDCRVNPYDSNGFVLEVCRAGGNN